MSDHARLSLSHTDTWLVCAAWPRMVEGFDDEESPEIEFGNVSHGLLENLLLGKSPDDFTPSEELACAMIAYDYVQKRWAEMGFDETTCLAEAHVGNPARDDLWGSADVVLFDGSELEIIDLKTGAGTYVDEQTSGQLMNYALAAIETFELNPTTIKLTIVQPRYWGNEAPIRTREVSRGDLAAWSANIMLPAAAATDDPNAPGTASVKCKRCAGRHTCQYRDAAVADALEGHHPTDTTTMEVQESMIRANQDAVIYDNERLSEVLMLIPVIRDYCDSLEEHAKEIIMKGERVSGYKVVAAGGRSKWLDEDAVKDALNKTQVNKNAYKHVLKTPKQVLSLVPKTNKKLAKKLEDLIGTGSGSLKLVLESEKGESAAPQFDAIPPILQEQNPVETTAELPAFLL